MRYLLFVVFVLYGTAARADVYHCPATYPNKDRPPAPLTGGRIMEGELHGNGWLMGSRDKPAKSGFDTVYGFDQGEGWLVCLYEGRERTGTDTGFAGHDWWLKLGPKESLCTIQHRQSQPRPYNAWTVTAVCVDTLGPSNKR